MIQQSFKSTQLIGWLLLLSLLASAGGCDKTATVTGKVSYQGHPVTHGSVIFLNAGNKARSGVIEPDGSYTVEGVQPGTVRIGVISHDPAKGRSVVRGEKPSPAAPPTGWFALPARFEDPAASGLTCIVGSSSASHDIEMK